MMENVIKKLIQNSTVPTSENFTDELNLKVEALKQKKAARISKKIPYLMYALTIMIAGGIVFFVILILGYSPEIEILFFKLEVGRIPFLIILLLLPLLGANHLLKLQNS